MNGLDELIKDFLVESYENLDQLDRDFVALETDPTARDKISSIFRTIHTIKGSSGCLGLSKLESVAHVGENLLSRLRDGQLVINSEITTGLLKLVDALREILGSIETVGAEGDKDYSAIRNELIRLNEEPGGVAASATASAPPILEEVFPIVEHVEVEPEAPRAATPAATPAHPNQSNESVAGNAIRVDVVLLDKLMNLVGELVLSRNQVLQYTASLQDVPLLRTAQRLNLITTELQESVMKTRMQPIGTLWSKFPRVVRDVATSCHKKVRIEMDGRETELDKTIIEAIKDPLTHILRNSIDHGVETPEKRKAAGKPEEGCINMRAYHEGGRVNIEIIDDGGGIDPERVKRKAVDKGLISADQAAKMNEREATDLIFLPGFSTAEKITNVSGRGVGMDVVKTNVEKIGGTVDVQSRLGEGTTLRIKIPLTLAIIPALVVTSGGERFCIPQVSLLELVRIEAGSTAIESIHGAPVYRLRGKLLPLVYLNRELKLQHADANAVAEASNIVVLRGGEQQFGLVVDQINDTEEIVVKPLGKQLKGVNVFAGATIMGDGRVALILDVMGLAHKANVISQSNAADATGIESRSSDGVERQSFVLCEILGEGRIVIPLSLVARLEEFPRSALEEAGGQQVTQYRGQIMPLIDVAAALGKRGKPRSRKAARAQASASTIQVVVYSNGDRNVGLRVDQVLDIVEEQVHLQKTAARPGVLGTAVIKEKVTEVLDAEALVQKATLAAAAA